MPYLQGLQSIPLGGALNTRASDHLFLEMHLRFCHCVFPILFSSGRGSETRVDKGLQSTCPEVP